MDDWLEAHKTTHGGDQRGEFTNRVWTKLFEDLCRYPGQSEQRRLCACQNSGQCSTGRRVPRKGIC